MSKQKKIIIAGIILAVVVIIAVGMILWLSSDNTKKTVKYDGLIDAQIAAINEQKSDYWLYSENSSIKQDIEYQKYYAKIIGKEDMYSNLFEAYFEEIEAECGGEYKVSFAYEKERKFDETELEAVREYFVSEVEAMYEALETNKTSISEELAAEDVPQQEMDTCLEMYEKAIRGYQNMDITEISELDIKVIIEKSNDSESFDVNILLAKIDGEWVFMQENEYLEKKHYVFTSGITPYTVCTNICEQ